jgi:hypothetical protein
MTPRNWLDVGFASFGVVTLVYGIWDLVHAALFYAQYFQNLEMTFRFYLIAGWCSIALGLILIRSAPILVNFAYGYEDMREEGQ